MIEAGEALRLLLAQARTTEVEAVDLQDAAGRALAEAVPADRDLPPTDRSAMDGFAVRAADLPRPGMKLEVSGEVRAGEALGPTRLTPGHAVRVFTGAIIPPGADAVVMVELTREHSGSRTIEFLEQPERGQHIRRRGEEIRKGEIVLEAGVAIHAAEIATLATLGRTRVRVHRPPQVHVLSTGDEVVEPDRAPEDHQVRNSNARALMAQLAEMHIRPRYLGIVPDKEGALESALETGLAADVLLVTGGVSVGAYDLVRPSLLQAGVRLLFHGVAVRPGKPLLAGVKDPCLVVGLPGNPVSTFTGFAIFVAPVLRRMMGFSRHENPELPVRLAERLRRRPDRTTYHLARIEPGGEGWIARPVRTTGSADVASLARANAFVVAPAGAGALEPGAPALALPWPAFDRR